jgi:hypothetical protein
MTSAEGSDRHLLINGDLLLTGAVWEPSGGWLALSLMDVAEEDPVPMLTLLNPATCETVPLPAMHGWFLSWGP